MLLLYIGTLSLVGHRIDCQHLFLFSCDPFGSICAMKPSRLIGCLELLMTSLSLLNTIVFGGDVSLVKPKNMAVISGQRMEMECRTEAKVTSWYFTPLRSNMPPVSLVVISGSRIQLNDNVSYGFGVNFDSNGSGIIYLNSTTVNDAGIYICEVEKDGYILKFGAHLIVFESEPICETNLTEDVGLSSDETFWMRCRVGFRSHWRPAVEWTKYTTSDGTETAPVADGIETVVESNSVCSTLTVEGHSISGVSFYSFRIFFSQTNSSRKVNASNIPEFSYNFSTDSVVFLSTASPPLAMDASSSKEGLRLETVYLMIVVIVGVLFLVLFLLIAIGCWIFVRRQAAAWMADIVSSYENNERKSRISRHSTIDDQRRDTNVIASADASVEQLRCRPTSDGYTDADDLQEETIDASHSVHSLQCNDSELYATLRKNVEPPRCLSIYAS